ncbi:MAG: cytochrome c oxidase subunit II [Gammaproteobacteria bacterium]|nr:cytochrome c oxidase subunit II [Gammaproteobacteria bacterium]MDH3371262.1 cytochrome c oxidase subunit II [Gammaproteobacteria bacterium]MDH3407281.1 cytochrome c oxidase subunit II [Gammaproteobacteria bacterium]MDH5487652.1 cytochrome c oxidase subunit II [Gammaproteobacteria bacterium]
MSITFFRRLSGIVSRLILGVSLWFTAPAAFAAYGLNFQKPVTPIGHKLLELHNLILIICVVIFVIVFGFMFYSIFAHRKSRGHKAAQFHENTTLEVVWTVIPFVILVSMALPSTATLIEMDDTSKSDLTVKITGYQWKWKYDYPDHDFGYFSSLSTPRDQIENKATKGEHYLLQVDNPIVLPVGKKVRLLVTANDVIHSWWVPQLGTKKDAIPGFINEIWTRIDEPGIYRGQCAELCGKDHGYMPIVVTAVSAEDFTKWVAAQKDKAAADSAGGAKTWSKDDLMEKGKKVYATTCAACHGANGEGVGPFPKMIGSKIANGPLADHMNIVMHGKAGTAMQAFAAQLSDTDLAAVVTFERNGFGNKAGDTVQPSQVKALRK